MNDMIPVTPFTEFDINILNDYGSQSNPYKMYGGFIGNGYYWFVALNIESAIPITSESMFNSFNQEYSSTSTTTSSTSTSDNMEDTIVQYVYYYPPPQMTPTNITSISSNGFLGLIAVNLMSTIEIGNYDIGNFGTQSIFLTPEAFINWYNNNIEKIQSAGQSGQTLTSLFNDLNSSVNTFSNAEDELQAYLSANGFYFINYTNSIGQYNSLSSAINPVNSYNFTSTELYILIKKYESQQTITSYTTTGTTTSGLISSSQYLNQINGGAATSELANNTASQSAITKSDLTNITLPNLSNVFSFANPYFDIGLLLLGLGLVAVIAK